MGQDTYDDLAWRDEEIERRKRQGLPTADQELDRLRRTSDDDLEQMRDDAKENDEPTGDLNAELNRRMDTDDLVELIVKRRDAGDATDELEAELAARRQAEADWADYPG